jgi:5-formyltetrahydrofolate cyclo-ligase
MGIMMKKKEELRKEILEKRILMSQQEVYEKSLKINNNIMKLNKYKESMSIMCYVDFRNEVSTERLIKHALSFGKRVSVPLITGSRGENKTMIASEITSLENDLETGRYGIYEPRKECIRIIDPKEINLIIVPGVVFDKNKNRIGYGAGYYDRFLSLISRDCLTIGVAFEIQLLNEIPFDENDVVLDMIITEERKLL